MVGTSRHVALAAIAAVVLGACQSGPAGTGGDTLNPSAQPPAVSGMPSAGVASFGTEPQVELVQLEATTDPSAGAEREMELVTQLRADAGMAALLGENGEAAFDALDAAADEFAQQLIADVAQAIDAGELPSDVAGQAARPFRSDWHVRHSTRWRRHGDQHGPRQHWLYDIRAHVHVRGVIQRAARAGEGTCRVRSTSTRPRTAPTGGRSGTTIDVKTGSGHVMMDIIMTSTDRSRTPPPALSSRCTPAGAPAISTKRVPGRKRRRAGDVSFETSTSSTTSAPPVGEVRGRRSAMLHSG